MMLGTRYCYAGLRNVGGKRLRAALTSASAEVISRNGFAAGATFEGEFSDVTRSYTGRGIARYVW